MSTKPMDQATRDAMNMALEKEIEKIRSLQGQSYRDYVIDFQLRRVDRHIGIVSFTRRWNSSLMWSHYADSHRGFCVGFDTNSEMFQTKAEDFIDGKRVVCSVEYSDKRIKIPVSNDGTPDLKSAYLLAFTKSTEWSYEEEVRMLMATGLCHKTIKNSPYDINLEKFDHKGVSEVILGARVSEECRSAAERFSKERRITLYQSVMSDTTFNMERLKLSP